MSDIGGAIRSAREKAGLTQKQLSKMAHMSRSYICDVENGRYNPSWKSLCQIHNAIGLDLNALSMSNQAFDNKKEQPDGSS